MYKRPKEVNAGRIGENLTAQMRRMGIGSQRLSDGIKRETDLALSPTRGTIENYMKGSTAKPNLAILRAAAVILGVPADWLIFDLGEPTPEDETERLANQAQILEGIKADVEKAITKGFPLLPHLSTPSQAFVWRTWNALSVHKRGPDGVDGLRVALELGRAIAAPLKALGIESKDLKSWALDNYVITTCTAIQFLTAESGLRTSQKVEEN